MTNGNDTDWAMTEAWRLLDEVAYFQQPDEVASALRAAHRKGKVEGLREAAKIAADSKVKTFEFEGRVIPLFDPVAFIIGNVLVRASELEAE